MTAAPRILAFAGSAREGSFNRRLVRIAVKGAEAAGARCTLVELRDHPLPLYDADLEAEHGLPEAAAKLRELFLAHDGLLIASPEYNSSISPLLKNTLDWVSRSADAEGDLSGYRGKIVSLMAASPGNLGGLRGLVHLRSLLGSIGCTVLPEQLTIRNAAKAFDADGDLAEPSQQERALALGAGLAAFLGRLRD